MKSNIFPFWMTAASVFIAINILVTGLTLYFNPVIFFENMDFESDNMLFLSQRLAALLIALGLSIIISIVMQSVSMLKLSMATYCIVTLQDTVLGFAYDDTGLMVRSFIFCVLAAFIVFIANGMKRKRKRMRFLKTTESNRTSTDVDDDD
jgi:hypothetical protein